MGGSCGRKTVSRVDRNVGGTETQPAGRRREERLAHAPIPLPAPPRCQCGHGETASRPRHSPLPACRPREAHVASVGRQGDTASRPHPALPPPSSLCLTHQHANHVRPMVPLAKKEWGTLSEFCAEKPGGVGQRPSSLTAGGCGCGLGNGDDGHRPACLLVSP